MILLIILSVLLACATAEVEYKRTGNCEFTQECVYKYTSTQYNYGEEDREVTDFSADVNWHCESSGSYGQQSANEYCFTLTDAVIKATADFNKSDTMNYTSDDQQQFLADELQGEFCYVQTSDGKIVSVHYGTADKDEVINIKRSIASTFQANFKSNDGDVEEADASSVHTSHYTFKRNSNGVTHFTRKFTTGDVITMASEVPQDALLYTKTEESMFVGLILQGSRGSVEIKMDFGGGDESEKDDDDDGSYDKTVNFSNEFQSSGTYSIEKDHCQQRSKRDAVFPDLTASDLKKGSLLAVIDAGKFGQFRIRKIRDAIPSVSGLFERLRKSPNDTGLVDNFRELLELEAEHGTPSGHTPVIDQLIEYYKKIHLSNKPQNVEMRKLIYSFLAVDGSLRSQQILGSLLTEDMGEDERDILFHQLAQISNAGPELVDTVININPSNDDGLLLVLGALARNNDHAIQTVVVGELLRRLDTVKSSTNDTELIILLNYALGNTGSKLAINALLSSLDHDDIDTQVSVIRGLGVHLDQPNVQKALIIVLNKTEEDKVLEEVLVILKEALDNKILVSPSEDLLDTIVKTAVKLDNPNLYELLIQYLTLVGTDGALQHINTLRRQHNYGQVIRDRANANERIRRGSDWDASNSDYNVVASQYQRRRDVSSYPYHKAYIWGKTFGISKLNMKMGAGAFAGAYWSGSTKRLKLYAKAAARAHVLGRTYTIADLEYSDYTSGYTLYHKVYVRLGSSVRTNINDRYDLSCRNWRRNLWSSRDYTVFYYRYGIWVYVANIYFYVRGTVSTSGNAGICLCPQDLRACANVVPSVTLRVRGGANAELAYLVRGGIDVSTQFTYYLEPNMCLQGLSSSRPIDVCLRLYHGYPENYVNIEPWYQFGTIYFSNWSARTGWGTRRVWNANRWRISGSSRRTLWSSCTSSISPCTI